MHNNLSLKYIYVNSSHHEQTTISYNFITRVLAAISSNKSCRYPILFPPFKPTSFLIVIWIITHLSQNVYSPNCLRMGGGILDVNFRKHFKSTSTFSWKKNDFTRQRVSTEHIQFSIQFTCFTTTTVSLGIDALSSLWLHLQSIAAFANKRTNTRVEACHFKINA